MKKFPICATLALLMASTGIIGCNRGGNNSSASGNPPSGGNYEELLEGFVPSASVAQFDNTDMDKVSITPTFNVSEHQEDASNVIVPYDIFANGMCLQRDTALKIWGNIAGIKTCHNVAVEFRGRVYYGSVKDAYWEVYLPKMTAGGPYELTIITNLGRKTLTDVYVGEVYLASGQSNMEWLVGYSGNVLKDLWSDTQACKNERLRLMTMGPNENVTGPVKTFANKIVWNRADTNTIRAFSAIGYIFGREMQKELGCPVGIICNSIGGSMIEFWMDEETLNKHKEDSPVYPNDSYWTMQPCTGFNGMIYPLEGLRFRGVVWNQGESNTNGTEKYYHKALKRMISNWRKFFRNDNMTFTAVQIARYGNNSEVYSIINEKINYVAENDPLVAKVVNLDRGDHDDPHYKDKLLTGIRAADETLRLFWGAERNVPPEIQSYEKQADGSVKITITENIELKNGNTGFEVWTNESGAYTFDCTVTAEGNVITVSAKTPITKIRYGYKFPLTKDTLEDPSKTVTVYDSDGLPLDIFEITSL